jgi:hypothetical protein
MTDRGIRERLLYLWPAKVISLVAAVLLYFFTTLLSLQTESISVPIQYLLPAGLTQSVDYPTRVRLEIRGDKDQILKLKDETFLVKADFSEHNVEGTYSEPLKLQLINDSAHNAETLSINLVPDEVAITLERSLSREVPVAVILNGKPKAGYELGEYYAVPSSVTVDGPQSRLSALRHVETDPISLDRHDQHFTAKVRLHTNDALVGIQNLEAVDVEIGIRSAAQLVTHQNVPIVLLGLPAGLHLEGSLPGGTVQLRDNQTANSPALPPLRMIADASQITEKGSYTLAVFPELLPSRDVAEFSPTQITVLIRGGNP